MSAIAADRLPVIVGIADVLDRAEPQAAKHPLQLVEDAIRAADADGGGRWLARIDSVDLANLMSWPYLNPAGLLAKGLGLKPGARCVHGPVGGESPLRFLQLAAQRIARGESEVAVVCGGEALSTAMKAGAARVKLDWPAIDPAYVGVKLDEMSPPECLKYGLSLPVHMYPLYENATRAAYGQTFADAQAESARIWSRFSEIAAASPHAWLRKPYTPEQISTIADDNRMICWPYPKRMVANNTVNMAAAVIVTSLAAARAAGIPDEKLIYVWDGCGADEPRSMLARDRYTRSAVQDAVLTTALARNGLRAAELGPVELYSCFPCVPKMARRTLGYADGERALSVTGGLTFFGAPINGYMVHATTAMVRSLRADRTRPGLLYGQGEFVTKHHTLVLGAAPPPAGVATGDYSIQAQADTAREPAPVLHDGYVGDGRIETYTVFFDRDGRPQKGVVIARNAAGERFVARAPRGDAALLAWLTDPAVEPVGSAGRSVAAGDGLLDWQRVS